MSADTLIGNWKLVSWQVIVEGQPQDLFGPKPKGYFILTREGRAMTLTTAQSRTAGDGEAERAALHKSMLAYTGRYRVDGDELVTTVDASWNEAWNGTEQRRRFRIEGNRLIIESAPAPSILFRARLTSAGSSGKKSLGELTRVPMSGRADRRFAFARHGRSSRTLGGKNGRHGQF